MRWTNYQKKGVRKIKKLMSIFTAVGFLMISSSIETHALSFDHLPKTQTSKQWLVDVGEAELDKTSLRPKKGVYNLYSFKVKNIGKNVDFVTVQAFRDEPNTNTKFALFSENKHSVRIEKKGQDFVFAVFPLSVKARELDIVVTWQENGIKRDLKETFVFK
jgi:hypothetical protein